MGNLSTEVPSLLSLTSAIILGQQMFSDADSHQTHTAAEGTSVCLALCHEINFCLPPSAISKVEHLLLRHCLWQPAALFCLCATALYSPAQCRCVWLSHLCHRGLIAGRGAGDCTVTTGNHIRYLANLLTSTSLPSYSTAA